MLSHEYYSLLLEHMDHAVFATDLEGGLLYFNRAASKTFGLQTDQSIGKKLVDLVVGRESENVRLAIRDALLSSGSWSGEVQARKKDGTLFDVEVSIHVVRDTAGVPIGTVCVGKDITERKAAEQALQAALREKELLLREVYHRVKNNLQVVLSLLSLQARRVRSKKTLDILKESQNRIKSMTLVHEKLHQSPDLTEVNVGGYLQGLAQHFLEAYGTDLRRVKLEIDAADLRLDSEKAMLCGFIVSELVSNALKHAFPNGRKGKVAVTLKPGEGNTIMLSVSDDGVGLPEGAETKKSSTLGLQLVQALVQQLAGKIEIDRTRGTTVLITFS